MLLRVSPERTVWRWVSEVVATGGVALDGVGVETGAVVLAVVPEGRLSLAPTTMTLGLTLGLACLRAFWLRPYFWAIWEKVSPLWMVWVPPDEDFGVADELDLVVVETATEGGGWMAPLAGILRVWPVVTVSDLRPLSWMISPGLTR